jgi:hypothetical protein
MPERTMPSKVPAPPILAIPTVLCSISFRWRRSAPTHVRIARGENAVCASKAVRAHPPPVAARLTSPASWIARDSRHGT